MPFAVKVAVSPMEMNWKPLLVKLVADLTADGHLRGADWTDAFTSVPRHVFVPQVIRRDGDGYRVLDGGDPAWLAAVYSDDSLVTRQMPHRAGFTLPGGEPLQVPTSSSTMPSLMARMLDVLDIHDGHRVLEIGTGTGYNAALLSHRLGDTSVVSVDIDRDLVVTARTRLAQLGYRPTLVAGDGTTGAADHGPYDRIVATAAVPAVPFAWIEQLKPGGKLLANLRGDLSGGALCLLTKENVDQEVIGPVLPLGGHFMWARPDAGNPHRSHEEVASSARGTASRTTAPPVSDDLVADDGFRFLLQPQLRGARSLTVDGRGAKIVTAFDGSRAESLAGQVTQSGPRRLWDTVEATVRLWNDLDRPGLGRFGIVANRSTQFAWLDSDEDWYRWPLPLV